MARFLALVLLLCSVKFSSETITGFNTNFADSAVCRNSEAVITCTVDSGVLRWEDSDGNDVTFNTGSSLNSINNVGLFSIVVNSISSDTISSTATVNVTSAFSNGTSITCFDGIILSANSKTAIIYVADSPGPPKNFRNTSTTFSSVTLAWSEPTAVSGVSITEYNIDIIKPMGTSCPASKCSSLSPSTSSVTISDLSFNTEYTFIISATSCGGVGANASLDVYLIAEAPDAPTAIESCISLVNNGKEMNLRVSWECPSVNEIRVPPILNYDVSVQSPSPLINPIDGVSVQADCRCTYSASVPLEEVRDVMYTAVVSTNNSVGANGQQISLYSSANITTSTAQATISTALIAVFISWTACEGLSADVILTYYRLTSSLVESSVTSQVTLPVDSAFISLNNLLPGTGYGYMVSLRSNGGIVLGESAEGTFETANADDAVIITSTITETVCTSVTTVISSSRQGIGTGTTTRSIDETPTAGRFEDCPTTNNSLLIGIGILAAAAIMFLIMFIIVLCICIRTVAAGKQRYSLNTVGSVEPPLTPSTRTHGYELNDVNPIPPPAVPLARVSTDMNMSYGHIYSSLKTSESGKTATYEEIKKTSSPHLSNASSPYEKDRPPIPVPYTEPVIQTASESAYIDQMQQNADTSNNRVVENPSYGTTTREEQPSPVNEDYLIVNN